MPLHPLIQRFVDFLRAGYPEGVPQVDYIPLFALLGRHMPEQEVFAVAGELAAAGEPYGDGSQAIRDALAAVSRAVPSEEEVARVQARLAAVGWNFEPTDGGGSVRR
jgi:hypothetical protein